MKKKRLIIGSILLFFLFLGTALFCTVFGCDEIWNYGFAVSIYKGLVPYRDFNMVITPFYPFLMSLPFHIFGINELVLQITNSLFLVIAFFFLDEIIGDKKYIVLFFFLFPLSLVFPSYNIFLFVFFVFLLYCEEKGANDIVIGLILGFLFLTKQTVGICILACSILFYLKNIKKNIKRILGFLIPVTIVIIYLIINNAFIDFIDLCFMGLIDFGSKNVSTPFIMTFVFILLIINALYYIIKYPKSIFNYYVLAFYSIMLPLIDIYHVQVAFLAFIVLNCYNLNISDKYDKYIKVFSIMSYIGIGLIIFISSYPYTYPNDINHFEYRLIANPNIKFTKKVNNYMKKHDDKEMLLLVADAYYFKIIQDKKINKLDLINNGNCGYNGSKKIVDELKKHKESLFIINEVDFNKKSQIDKGALYYIKNNYKKVDSIGIYDIYSLE